MKLLPNDRVAIVSPASQMRGADVDLIGQAIDVLRSWSLQVDDLTCPDHHFYLAGRDEDRYASLKEALRDPGIRAVFCTRGGYGTARLYRFFEPSLSDIPGKYVVGYSDLSALHLAMASNSSVVRVHGPNVATSQFLSQSEAGVRNRESLRSFLFSDQWRLAAPVRAIREGVAEGTLEGGCLSLLVSALGSRFAPSASGSIAFIEDTGEPPYKIDRMLVQLKNAGYFHGVQGIVFGQMKKCTDPHNDLIEVIKDVLRDFQGPIGFGLPSGHGELNLSIPLGNGCFRLDCFAGSLSSV